ncbi:MAG: NUDIX domain-containing protein, partial [Bacteroidota bacterium]
WRPASVEAGGGYVVRRTEEGIDLLMIHRRRVWDLPKGKLDPGETPEAAAVREVSEEVGIELATLTVLGVLPPTVHGYIWPKREVYAVKTTHWYAMTTTAETFEPEEREGIERVAYVPWAQAGRQLGYESLRQHHAAIDPGGLGI